MIKIQKIIEYLSENITDPVPNYIMQKEIYKESVNNPNYKNAYKQMRESKWYLELVNEQLNDGSWGRFHTQDSKAPKRKFVTTETALRRAHELSLSKDDQIISKCIKLMERYVLDKETWTDSVEKHHDNGKSHLYSRSFVTAANINLFDPENSVIKPKRDIFVKTLKVSLEKGYFDEEVWENENKNYRGPCLNGWNAYPLMILQNSKCMDDTLQRKYLNYIWNRKDGIYYLTDYPISDIISVEDNRFNSWLKTLWYLSGFSLFEEIIKKDVLKHLIKEIERLINNDIVLPGNGGIGTAYNIRYADKWSSKNEKKVDMILRITRVIIKYCNK
jgi:hypothetical protein